MNHNHRGGDQEEAPEMSDGVALEESGATLSGALLVDYKLDGRWLTVVAAPGESYEECVASMQRLWPQIEGFRPHGAGEQP